jgi:hypothetical protein
MVDVPYSAPFPVRLFLPALKLLVYMENGVTTVLAVLLVLPLVLEFHPCADSAI